MSQRTEKDESLMSWEQGAQGIKSEDEALMSWEEAGDDDGWGKQWHNQWDADSAPPAPPQTAPRPPQPPVSVGGGHSHQWNANGDAGGWGWRGWQSNGADWCGSAEDSIFHQWNADGDADDGWGDWRGSGNDLPDPKRTRFSSAKDLPWSWETQAELCPGCAQANVTPPVPTADVEIGLPPDAMPSPNSKPVPPAAVETDWSPLGDPSLELGRAPMLGEDLPWFGPPQLVPVLPADQPLLEDHDVLFLYRITPGHFLNSDAWYCGCCDCQVDDVAAHLGGYHKESRKHFKNTLFVAQQQQMVASQGWQLAAENIAIYRFCFVCNHCNAGGEWYDAFRRMASKNHINKADTAIFALPVPEYSTDYAKQALWRALLQQLT